MNYAMNVKRLDSVASETMWNFHLSSNPIKLGSPQENKDDEAGIDNAIKSRGIQQ